MAIAARYEAETRAPEKTTDVSVATVTNRRSDARRRTSMPLVEDVFSTLMPWTLLVITALPFVAQFFWLVVTYVGVEYGAPPLNAHSVPPPRLY